MTSTKELIFETFVELLKQKPFDKITVRNIVEAANINRNTFYYYYSDIYELLEEIFTNELTELVANHNNGFRWIVGFSKMLKTSYENKAIINNICASRSYEYFETYMFKSCRIILNDFVHEICEDKAIDEDMVEFIVSFYMNGITGSLSEWFRTGMPETPDEIMHKFLIVFEGIGSAVDKTVTRITDDGNQ